ncbi:hypothetical protein T261_1554 [Streptomyces lydicus]|nr:hypothetical protein T261_1554 [Streptomyces lydicus]
MNVTRRSGRPRDDRDVQQIRQEAESSMIHPDRKHLVRTRELLAQDMGMPMGTFRNKKPYAVVGFPAPISSAGARVLLWDGEQTAAYLARKPVPELPAAGGPRELLDRQEAAVELHVTPRTWDGYKTDPRIAPHLVVICGVEHWPRGVVHAFRDARPGKESAAGRPKGKANVVPRGELHKKVAALLDAEPAITISGVRDALGVAPAAAQRALSQLRGERIARLMEAEPSLSFTQAADRLGFRPRCAGPPGTLPRSAARATPSANYRCGPCLGWMCAMTGIRTPRRLLLRRWHDDDLAAMADIHADPRVMRPIGCPAPG